MVEIKNDLTTVMIYWEGSSYQIKVEDIDYTDKQDLETIYSSDSHEPNQIVFGKFEYSVDLSGCQTHRWLFNWIKERQKRGYFKGYPRLTTYRTGQDGKVYIDKQFTAVFVEEIKQKNQEGYDVKLIPLGTSYRNSKNQLI